MRLGTARKLAILVSVLMMFAPCGFAATLTVTNLNDAGAGSLRDQVAAAAPGDTINFGVAGTIGLTTGEIAIGKNLTIAGPGAGNMTVQRTVGSSRVFNVTTGVVVISGITIAGGNVAGNGGGIQNAGALTVQDCVIQNNVASVNGGGIYNSSGLSVSNTTFTGNTANGTGSFDGGGGLYTLASVSVNVQTSTFTGNTAPGQSGGAVFFRGSPVTMTNCTLSGNSSPGGGGFRSTSANLTVHNSTITNNSGGGFQDSGNTYIRNTISSGNIGGAGDAWTGGGIYVVENCIFGGSPLLGPLTNNGGPTLTHALMDGSPAIDAGNPVTCAATDQRGVGRPIGSACDIGAVESNLADLAVTVTDAVTTRSRGAAVTYTIVASNAGPATTNANVVDTFPAGLTGVTWLCSAIGGASCGAASGIGNINETIALPSGGSVTFTATASVSGTASGTISNTATVSTQSAGVADPLVANNSASDSFLTTVVTNLNDSGAGSLRDIVAAATAGDTIEFAVTGTIVLATGEILIDKNIDISGPGADLLAISGNNASRMFRTFFANTTISGLTLTQGNGAGAVNSGYGGAVYVEGTGTTVTIDGCLVTGNATGGFFSGGGVWANGGTIRVLNSTVSGNSSLSGSGIAGQQQIIIVNSTISSNTGSAAVSAVSVGASMLIASTTVANNSGGGLTGNLAVPTSIRNSLLVGNGSSDCSTVAITSQGYNVVGSGCTGWIGSDKTGQAPGIGPLQANGGSTPTHGLVTGSVALDAGNPGGCTDDIGSPLLTDQRGFPRAFGAACDAGAFEQDVLVDLAVMKTGPTTAVPGTSMAYTIVVSNAGPSSPGSVSIQDTFDSVLTGVTWTCLSAGGAACPSPSGAGNISQTATALPAAGSLTYAVSATLSPSAAGTLANTATVSLLTPATGADLSTSNNSSGALTSLVPSSDLSVIKGGPASIVPGVNATYTVTVMNNGPSDATGVSVQDVTPSGLTFVSNTGDCATSYPCMLGAIPAGATRTITTTFGVPSGYVTPDPVVNTATVTASTPDPLTVNDSSTSSTPVAASADLSVTKSGLASIVPGVSASYTITVTNNGPSDATGVTVQDPTPSGLTFVSNAGDCSTAYPCALGVIPAGATRTITTIFGVPSSYTSPDPVVNTATVSSLTTDPVPANDTASASAPVAADADLAITKAGPASVVPGQNAVYTVTVTNNGPSDATGVNVQDPTPSGLTFVSNAGDCVSAYPCTLGAIPAGATRTITTSFGVPSSYTTPDPVINIATAASGTPDSTTSNDTASTSTPVVATVDLAVSKVGPASVVPGQNVTYTVTVTNNGPSDAVGVTVQDPTPSGLTFVSNAGDCATAYPCALGALPAGASKTITTVFSMPPAYAAPNPLVNIATVSSAATDPVASNNAASASSAIGVVADLAITKTTLQEGTAGQNITYVITVTNHGPSVAPSVVVADPDVFPLSHLANSGACTTSFPCTLTNLQVGESRTITAGFAISSGATTETATNTVTVSLPTGTDPNPANNSASAESVIQTLADLVLRVSQPQFVGGDTLTFTVTIQNLGPSDAETVKILIPTPAGLTLESAPPGCVNGFPCTIGPIAADTTIGFEVKFRITGTTASPLVIQVSADSPSDPNISDNSVSVSMETCPSPVTDLKPLDGAIDVARTGALEWTTINADLYEVYFGPAGSGCTNLVGTTQSTTWPYTNLKRRSRFEWKVIGKKAGCSTGDVVSACQTFDSGPPCPASGPKLLAPAEGSAAQQSPFKFEWQALPGAVSYRVWASIDDTPAVVIGTSTGTALAYDASPGAFVWWVEAIFDDCPSVQSAQGSFTTSGSCVTRAAVLDQPADGAELASPVTFDWEPVAGAQSYSVWLSVDGKFPIVVASTTTETQATVAVPSGDLRWYVQSRYDKCPPAISKIRRIVVPARPECAENEAPTVMAPFSGQRLLSPIEFEWTAVPNATGYAVWVSIDGDTPSIVATTDGATRVEKELRPGEVTWFVQANFEQCPSTETAQDTFVILAPGSCDFDAPLPIRPAHGSVSDTSVVTFEWLEAAGAVEYRLWASTGSAPAQFVAAIPATQTSVELQMPNGTSHWYLEALFVGCPPKRSVTSTLTVPEGTNCGTDTFATLAPPSGVSIVEETDVQFLWQTVPEAIEYRLWLVPDNGSKTLIAATDATSHAEILEPGSYIWFVEAVKNGCPPAYSDSPRLTITENPACKNRAPTPLAPLDGVADLTSPVTFVWTPVSGATSYRLSISLEGAPPIVIDVAPDVTESTVPLPPGVATWHVEASAEACARARSTESELRVIELARCSIPAAPSASVVGEVTEGESYRLLWDRVPGATIYEVQQTSRFNASIGMPDFKGETVIPTTSYLEFTAPDLTGVGQSTTLYYRVRGIADCDQQRGPYSKPVAVVVTGDNQSAQIGSLDPVYRDLKLCADETGRVYECVPGKSAKRTSAEAEVSLTPTEPWLTVDPSEGTIPAGGSLTVRVGADPSLLATGTSTAALLVNVAGKTAFGSTGSVPVSVGLASPVTPSPKTTPPPYAQIIPAVIHGDSASGSWQSDIRILNTGARRQKYQLSFTPSDVDGTQQGKQAVVEVGAGEVLAFDDVVRSWYGAANRTLTGVLEVRPLNVSSGTQDGSTVASSRTYNNTPLGSFGQFIPGVPFSRFVGRSLFGENLLLLQQIAQSSRFRTNFGFVEASGQAVDILVKIFDSGGALLGEKTISLEAGQHTQINSMLAQMGVAVDDARAEIRVTSDNGKISAYASVVDALTSDPTFLPAVAAGESVTLRRVLPGIADLDTGQNRWRSDVRIYNPNDEDVETTLTFYPQGAPEAAMSLALAIGPRQIAVLDDVLRNRFDSTNIGGALHVVTATESALIVTARTYDKRSDGTVGQYIPALTEPQAASRGGRILHILQVEESERLRTNLGVAEMSGSPVEIQIMGVVPRSLAAPSIRISLAPFEFLQIGSIFKKLGFDQVFNGRLIVRVVEGDGKVIAYASSVDNKTGDPAYIPAQ